MRGEDISVINKMLKYCQDIDKLMARFNRSYETYKNDISFQYSCNMCIRVDLEMVWNTLMDDIPDLQEKLEGLLKQR